MSLKTTLLVISLLCFNPGALQQDQDLCKVEMSLTTLKQTTTVAELCDAYKGLDIINYSLKVPGNATLQVDGGALTDAAKTLIRNSKKGDEILIFKIKATSGKEVPPLRIRLVY